MRRGSSYMVPLMLLQTRHVPGLMLCRCGLVSAVTDSDTPTWCCLCSPVPCRWVLGGTCVRVLVCLQFQLCQAGVFYRSRCTATHSNPLCMRCCAVPLRVQTDGSNQQMIAIAGAATAAVLAVVGVAVTVLLGGRKRN